MDPIAHLNDGLAGRYRVERELGRGGMAIVYLAQDLRHARPVAIKVLRPEIAESVGAGRFQREIEVAARLQHPGIVGLLDSGVLEDGLFFYVMPFIAGESLRARLERERQLPVPEAVRLAREVAEALDYAHRQGVIHRDIKPENILLADGHAMVADFGVARALEGNDRLTSTGLTVGTPTYMSPEQSAADRQLDARSDLYALATVTYEMLAGEPPFTGPSVQAILARRIHETPRSLRITREQVPPALEETILRGLRVVPADRQASCSAFARELESSATLPALPGGAPVTARGESAWPARILLVGTGLLALGAAGFFALRRPAAPAPAAAPASPRIAVLPLANLGGAADEVYFADGMTDELITTLSHLPGLQVISRTSVMAYRDSMRSAPEIGQTLGVGSFLEGTVRHAGDRVRISLRLVDVATQSATWDSTFDERVADVFAIQGAVARQVAAALRIRLSSSAARLPTRAPTADPEAYDLFLRGMYWKGTGLGREAIERTPALFGRAAARDPSFAAAWAELAAAENDRIFTSGANPAAEERAWVALQKALALDSTLDLAWVARAELTYTRQAGYRLDEGLRYARRAVELNPNSLRAQNVLGSHAAHAGLNDLALAAFQASLALDPTSSFARYRLGRVLWFLGRYEEALRAYEAYGEPAYERAVVLQHLGRLPEAEAYLARTAVSRQASTQPSDWPSVRAILAAAAGRNDEARTAIAEAVRAGVSANSHFHHAAYNIAAAWALLGQRDSALAWLERTASDGMPNYPLFATDPNLRRLKGWAPYEQVLAAQKQAHDRFMAAAAPTRRP